jgi:tRNA pseudouridine38-40 synthase
LARNLKLTLAYDGHDFAGWQVQPDRPTIQGTLVSVLEQVTGETVLPQGSGRTDAGVHALAQVASVSIHSPIPAQNLARAMNDLLPRSIRVLSVEEMPPEFHARKSAVAKTYRYRIFRGDICPPFLARYVYHHPYPLDEARMIAAAKLVEGEHDFTSFAAVDPERGRPPQQAKILRVQTSESPLHGAKNARVDDPERPSQRAKTGRSADLERDSPEREEEAVNNVRKIFRSEWRREGDELHYTVRGNGFLHHMVRNLVGTFLMVGKGSLKIEDVRRILELRDRSAAAATAPASGLFLVNVEYE